MKKNNLIISVVVVIVVGVAAFFGGMQYQKSQRASFAGGQFRGQNGQFGRQFQGRGNLQAARPVNGQIINQDQNSVTVKMQDGSSKIVILSDKTTINKTTTASKEDLKNGTNITAFGSTNSDGSITAQNISIGNAMFARPQNQGSAK